MQMVQVSLSGCYAVFVQSGDTLGASDVNNITIAHNEVESQVTTASMSIPTDYQGSIISLPSTAQGRVTWKVLLKGLTATNLVTNGDFSNGTTGLGVSSNVTNICK